jgi:hypothetical protein
MEDCMKGVMMMPKNESMSESWNAFLDVTIEQGLIAGYEYDVRCFILYIFPSVISVCLYHEHSHCLRSLFESSVMSDFFTDEDGLHNFWVNIYVPFDLHNYFDDITIITFNKFMLKVVSDNALHMYITHYLQQSSSQYSYLTFNRFFDFRWLIITGQLSRLHNIVSLFSEYNTQCNLTTLCNKLVHGTGSARYTEDDDRSLIISFCQHYISV